MKRLKLTVFALIAVLAGAALALPAHAHGPRARAHIGLSFGFPLAFPYWGYSPYPYHYYRPFPSQVIVVPSEPATYVEQPRVEAAPEATGYWYYCGIARAYYPYVKECPGGWQRVAPRPPGE